MKKVVGFELAAAAAEVVYGIWKTVSEGLKPIKDWWAGPELLFARPRATASRHRRLMLRILGMLRDAHRRG